MEYLFYAWIVAIIVCLCGIVWTSINIKRIRSFGPYYLNYIATAPFEEIERNNPSVVWARFDKSKPWHWNWNKIIHG